ncbi:protein of unknown function [Candidatus Nitrotoga arctica]|uniref:Anti-bacteriophage protein A/HamA C-terminal domain-containing protein n=1 Tax=Candidatus Nitrotoga arctica TaxID=453162 RepID=A0ABM8Z0C4_9PROT|nr:protein of unknown function [Candidatus Nitrotoga arctica]
MRWKVHRNMSMRGEDVLAFGLDAATGDVLILKGEAKSRVSLSGHDCDHRAKNALCEQGPFFGTCDLVPG